MVEFVVKSNLFFITTLNMQITFNSYTEMIPCYFPGTFNPDRIIPGHPLSVSLPAAAVSSF